MINRIINLGRFVGNQWIALQNHNGTLNTWRSGKNSRHFTDGIFQSIFFKGTVCILIWISPNFVSKCLMISQSVQIMVWCWIHDKPLPEAMMIELHVRVTRLYFYQTRSAWSVDQGSNKNHSPAYNLAPTATKFCVVWEGQALPQNTKFGNCRCKIVDSRAFPSWSLIHGLRWSGLIKAEPDLVFILWCPTLCSANIS